MGQFVKAEGRFYPLEFLEVLDVFLQQTVKGFLVELLPVTKCSDDILDIADLKPLNFPPHFQNMMSPQYDLKQLEIALKKIEFVVFNLLELVELQIPKAQVKYSLHSIGIGELKETENIIGLNILFDLPFNLVDIDPGLEIIQDIQRRCQLFHGGNFQFGAFQQIHYFLENSHLHKSTHYIQGLSDENNFLFTHDLIIDQLAAGQC